MRLRTRSWSDAITVLARSTAEKRPRARASNAAGLALFAASRIPASRGRRRARPAHGRRSPAGVTLAATATPVQPDCRTTTARVAARQRDRRGGLCSISRVWRRSRVDVGSPGEPDARRCIAWAVPGFARARRRSPNAVSRRLRLGRGPQTQSSRCSPRPSASPSTRPVGA